MRPEEHQAYSFEDERKRIEECFCAFVEGSLVSHDIDAVLQLFCDDVIGIGMGAQGIVRCREDLRPILMNTRSDVDDSQTAIDDSNMQVRYYGDDYASINAMVSVTTTVRGERRTSHIGQCASLRRIDGQWRINMVQATPLSIDIQDIDSSAVLRRGRDRKLAPPGAVLVDHAAQHHRDVQDRFRERQF